MLGNTRRGLTLWLGAGAVILSVGLTGCGGHKKSSSAGATAAPATSGTTSSTTSGTTGGTTTSPTTSGTTTGGTVPGGTIPGGGVPGGGPIVPPPGGGGTTPPGGGGTTPPGGGGTTPPGGGTVPPGVTDDHGNSGQAATAAGMANPLDGRIDYAGDADWFKVNLTNGVSYDFLTLNLGAGMDTIIRVVDMNGTAVVAENDDVAAGNPASRVSFAATATGEHYVVVTHKDATATSGTYQVNYILTAAGGGTPPPDDHGNDIASASAIALTIPTNGNIEVAGDADFFKITLTGGQAYDFRTNTTGDTMLTLVNSSLTVLAFNDDEDLQAGLYNSLITGWPCPADGEYYLIVEGWNGQTTPQYEIVANVGTPPPPDDHGNDNASATAITLGAPTAGKIEVYTDEDYFMVDLVGGQSYDLRTITAGGQAGDTQLFIFDGTTGQQIGFNDDEDYNAGMTNSLIANWPAPADGTYYLVVTGYQGFQTTPDYEIKVDLVGAPPPPPPPPPGGTADDHGNDWQNATQMAVATPANTVAPTAGKIEVSGDEDWFKVDLAANQDYVFRTITMGDTELFLYDTNGTSLLDHNDDDLTAPAGQYHSRLVFPCQTAGTYYLKVTGLINATLGTTTTPDYELAAEEAAAPPAGQVALGATSFMDVDGSNRASQGDQIVLTFSGDVTHVQIATFPPPPLDPNMDFVLPVAGDSFGTGATWAQTGTNEVTITLGADPKLRLSGTFDAANVTAGSASGIDVNATTTLTDTAGGALMAGVVDLDTTLTPGFYAAAPLNEARGYHTATLLDDGRVLVVGGLTNGNYAYSSEVYDAGTWTDVTDPSLGGNNAIMAALDPNGQAYYIARYDHTATKLPNGQVLIAGGVGFEALFDPASGAPIIDELQSAFIFDPQFNEFIPTTNTISVPRRGHYATLMPNGQVLIVGGYNSNVNNNQGGTLPFAEVFDPATGTFTLLQGMNLTLPREGGAAIQLSTGQMVYAGGYAIAPSQTNPANAAIYMGLGTDVYDMATGAVQGPALLEERRMPAVVGNYVLGGNNGLTQTTFATVEKFVEATGAGAPGAFTAAGTLRAPRARGKAVMVGDDILVVGGVNVVYQTGAVTYVNVTTGELFNTTAGVSEEYQMQSDRNTTAAVGLPDGRVLVVGGFSGGTTLTGLNGTALDTCEAFSIP